MFQYSRSKQMAQAYKYYLMSDNYKLENVYNSYSTKKENAFIECRKTCYRLGGSRPKIVSHNQKVFTFGFIRKDESGEEWFYWMTPSYDRFARVRELEEKLWD